MKKLIAILGLTLLCSCTTSNHDKLIGSWYSNEHDIVMKMSDSGLIKYFKNDKLIQSSPWELTDGNPPILKINDKGDHVEKCEIMVLTDDDLSFKADNKILTFTRIKK